MEILRKTHKEILEIKSTVIKMKNVFHGLIGRLETAEERIFEFKDDTITSKIENQSKRENKTKQKTEQNRKEYPRTVGQLQKM